jgi:hypothetical protein
VVKSIQELLWFKTAYKESWFSSEKAMKLYCDNQSSIKMIDNPIQYD